MKKFILAAMLLAPTAGYCWEFPKNPDRFPSLGFNYTGVAETGNIKATNNEGQDLETKSGALVLDTRMPLSDSFTLYLGIGATSSNIKGKESSSLLANETDTSGGLFTIGGRYYFNR